MTGIRWSSQRRCIHQLTSLHSVLVRSEYFSGNFSLHRLQTLVPNTLARQLAPSLHVACSVQCVVTYLEELVVYLQRLALFAPW
jgi:hypothetical protein